MLTGIEQDFCTQMFLSELCVLSEVFLVVLACLKSTITLHEVVFQSASEVSRGIVSKFFYDLSILPTFPMTLTGQEYCNLVVLENAYKKPRANLPYLVRRHEQLSI